MIEHLIHAVFHATQEGINEEQDAYYKRKEQERKLRIQANQPKIKAILKDCESAVLLAAKNHNVSLRTKKWDANIDYHKMCQILKDKGYPQLNPLDMKLIFTFDPISLLAECACDRICDRLKIEHD